jgi:peptidyl-prolyl cis-trans isomerase SurA
MFAELARKYSDDASSTDGGEIEPLQPGDVPPEFERAAMALKPGERSPVVESPYGFHIIERRSDEKLAVQQILIRYAGAKDCPDSIVRGRAEALALAQKVLGEVRTPDSSFPVAASIYSEDQRSNTRGGYVGEFVRGNMDPQFEAAVAALHEGEISGVVETREGFHILKRVKPMRIRVAHILITHSGSLHLDSPSKRTREEALQRAGDVLFRAKKGEDFAALAKEYSEDPISKDKGGRMWAMDRGDMVPEFEEAAFALQPGQVSDIVETEFGFHIIKRLY